MEERKEVIIELLKEKDMYGFEMIKELENQSNQLFNKKAGTLFPILRLLEKQKYLKTYVMDLNGKLRKYYKLTRRQGGRTRLEVENI